jgi:hypothetical protein
LGLICLIPPATPLGIILLIIAIVQYNNESKRLQRWQYEQQEVYARKRAEEQNHNAQVADEQEAKYQRLKPLVERGAVIPWRNLTDEAIQCSNGHVYRLGDFFTTETGFTTDLQKVSNEGTYMDYSNQLGQLTSLGGLVQGEARIGGINMGQTVPVTSSHTTKHFGCPTCHSTLFKFEKEELQRFKMCVDMHWSPVCQRLGLDRSDWLTWRNPLHIQFHVYSPEFDSCPILGS